MDNHYATLGVAEDATQDDIKKVYRKLASTHHPDKGGDGEKFKTIQTAYDILGNAEKRAEYDEVRKRPQGFGFNNFGGMSPGMEDLMKNFGFHFSNGDGHPFQPRQHRRNKDIQVQIVVELVDTLSKFTKIVSIKTTNGDRQSVNVDIPKGIHNGATIKYSGLGDNFFATLPRGDLYVQIHVKPHPLFQINGIDLFAPIDIDALDAILGCKQLFTTLDKTQFELTIPSGIQGGVKFKIPNQGLYGIDTDVRGNLYLVATIKVPTNLTPTQIETIKQIKADTTQTTS
jgi:curved DNA-binding protein